MAKAGFVEEVCPELALRERVQFGEVGGSAKGSVGHSRGQS